MITLSEPGGGWTLMHSLGAAALALLLAGSVALTFIWFDTGYGWVGVVGITVATMAFPSLIMHAKVRPIDYRPAMRRHTRRMLVSTTVYLATLFGATWAFRSGLTVGPIGYVIAVAPALPALAMFGSMFFILREENDEFVRARIIEASMWAAGLTFAEAMVWGFLETFGKVPHVWMWTVPLAFIVQFGFASVIFARRYR